MLNYPNEKLLLEMVAEILQQLKILNEKIINK